jgi:two-component system, OmpR family, response regulator PhoP
MTEPTLPSAYASKHPLHVIVLEDDADLRQQILLPLRRTQDFVVRGASSTVELYQHMLVQSFDIAVLGFGPEDNGLAVMQQLRTMSDIGIVALIDDADSKRHLRALRAGADVCLIMPTNTQVLAATLKNLARRLPPRTSGRHIRDRASEMPSRWRLQAGGWRLTSPQGQTIQLNPAEQCVVTILAQRDGQPVSRESLIIALGLRAEDFDSHRLEMMVHRLRKKALDQTGERLPLLTSRGVGYLFPCDTDASLGVL